MAEWHQVLSRFGQVLVANERIHEFTTLAIFLLCDFRLEMSISEHYFSSPVKWAGRSTYLLVARTGCNNP